MSAPSCPVALVPVDRAHLPIIRTWLLDPLTRELVGTTRPPSDVQHEEWHQRISHDGQAYTMTIVESASDTAVGICGLSAIEPVYRSAELWIYLGAQRRGGLGSAAVSLLLSAAFNDLGLHRVAARVFGFNLAAHDFFHSCGFTDEGRQRDAVFKRGAFHDVLLLGILEHEFRESQGA